MMKKLLLMALLWCSLSLFPFSGWSQYVTNGSTIDLGNNCYQLTPPEYFQGGAVWFQNKITLNENLSVQGTLNLGSIDGGGADGIAFVLQPICSGLGSVGGGIGYLGIAPSIAFEFDTWQNGDVNDPAEDHIALMRDGDINHGSGNNLAGPDISQGNLEDGLDHTFDIEWDAATNTLSLIFDGNLLITYSDDIVTSIFSGNANVFWGFTAATGAAINYQTVCISNVSFTEEGSYTATSPSCPDFNNGAIDLNPAGGIAPFSYAWSNGAVSEDVSGLSAGSYSVTVTDGNGCQSDFSIVLTNELDVEAPEISCPGDITVNNDLGECGAKVCYNVTSTDGCTVNSLPGFTYLGTLGNSSYFVSAATFTWLDALADSRANGLHMASVTSAAENDLIVNGLIANGLEYSNPWIGYTDEVVEGEWKWTTCEESDYSNWHPGEPNNLVGGTEHYANYYNNGAEIKWNDLPNSLPGWTPNPYVLELEGTQLFLLSGLYSGEEFPVGSTTVTYQAVDAAGNSSECSFTVTVVDNEVPVAVCQDISVTLAGGSATITPGDVDGGSGDNCSFSMSLSQSTFGCSDIGVVPVTLMVTDGAGNSTSCIANVTVVGEIPACTIAAVPGSGPYTGGPATTIYLGYGPTTVTLSGSASGGSSFSYVWSPAVGLSCTDCAAPVFTPAAEGNYTFTLTVTNEFGCASTCTITICVLDIRVPGTNGKKVYLCHVPPGNPNNPQTLSISVNAVPAHIPGHAGDHLGKCDQSCDNLKGSIAETGELITTWDGEFSVIIYPNPFTSDFRVSVETESTEPVSLKIYDLTGKVLQELEEITPEKEIIAGNDLRVGMYIMKIQQGSQVQNVRIIKQR